MKKKYNNIALILAGGLGSRVGGCIPKQYLKLGHKTILRLSIEKFINHPEIDMVKVVINRAHEDLYNIATYGITDKLASPCLDGAETRQDSARMGLRNVELLSPKNILIHDAARPFITHAMISEVIQQLKYYKAVDIGIDVKDTLKSKQPHLTYDRANFYLTHTPQGFDYETITMLHEKYQAEKFTDEISMCIKEKMDIGFVASNPQNIKITTPHCLIYGEFIVQERYITRVGYGVDIHKFIPSSNPQNTIKLCAVEVPFNKALSAHSDGDVALHALTDSLLGAMGEEDIGTHFPPSDEKYKGADSVLFLEYAHKLLLQQGGTINNIDITIITEKPHLKNFKPIMRKKIAQLLGISDTQVSVKAKTSEKLGYIGREEGIAASVICAISLPILEKKNE